jgi:hypothetical protein
MDERERNYTRKMYEYVLQQQYMNSYDYTKYMMPNNMGVMGQNMQNQYGMNYQTNGMLPMPNQIMRPNNTTNGLNLGQN